MNFVLVPNHRTNRQLVCVRLLSQRHQTGTSENLNADMQEDINEYIDPVFLLLFADLKAAVLH